MYRTSEDARALLGAAQEIHAERHGSQTFTLGTHLPLEAVGERIGIGPNSIRYHEAIEELEYEGAIEWATSAQYARGNKHYVITQHGLDSAR
jgi:predicted ArsR family transcriptional regulator